MEKQNYEVKNVSVVETLYIQQKASKLTYHKPFLEKKKKKHEKPKMYRFVMFYQKTITLHLLLPQCTTTATVEYFIIHIDNSIECQLFCAIPDALPGTNQFTTQW